MARKSVIEMYSTYNEVKPVVTERFIRALTLFRMALFGTANRWGGGGGGQKTPSQKSPFPKTCHTYPTKIKLGIIIPYLKKTQNIYESRNTPLEFC